MENLRSIAAEWFTGGAALANLSYLLLIVSMLMSSMTWLRILAIGSGIAGVLYFWVILGDRVASFWEKMFIAANLFQLTLTAYRDRMSRFDPDEMIFRSACIAGLSPSDARRLLQIGRVAEAPTGTYLTRERENVAELAFILSGDVDIRLGDKHIGRCRHGDFVGEIGVMSGTSATAPAVAVTPVRYLSFDGVALRRLVGRDRTIGQELELAFRQGLREKLVRANAALASQPLPLSS